MFLFLLSILPPPPTSTLFPYTTLFRSPGQVLDGRGEHLLRREPYLEFAELLGLLNPEGREARQIQGDRKSTRLNSSHVAISYAVFCLKKKKIKHTPT